MACLSSGVGSGRLPASSSESSSLLLLLLLLLLFSTICPTPAVAASTAPEEDDDCRVASCGFRLSTVMVGLKSCLSGTSERVSAKWKVCGASLWPGLSQDLILFLVPFSGGGLPGLVYDIRFSP